MARAEKYLVKHRSQAPSMKWTPWDTVSTVSDRAAADKDLASAVAGQTIEEGHNHDFCIFHRGKIVSWFRNGKDISAQSRQAPSSSAAPVDNGTDPYHEYTFEHGKDTIAIVNAREGDTAMRFFQNNTHGIDMAQVTMQEAENPSDIRGNFFIFFDQSLAPMLPPPEAAPAAPAAADPTPASAPSSEG